MLAVMLGILNPVRGGDVAILIIEDRYCSVHARDEFLDLDLDLDFRGE